MTRTAYRASQFVQALLAQPAADDVRLAAEHLPPTLIPLFERLSRAEQSHAIALLHALLQQGRTDPDLLAAGLLHDVGKTRAPLRLMDRVLVVLAQSLAPSVIRSSNGGDARGWRRPFIIAARHAEWGAELLQQHGASPRLVDLVRRHHASPPSADGQVDPLLDALQSADGSH
jgi:putative nucleotidyltransferase with HDIG domain